MLSNTNDDAKLVRSIISDNSLYLVPYGATHHTADSDTWLDLCMVDEQDHILDFWKSDVPFVAGHDLIAITLDIPICTPNNNSFSYRNFKSIDSTALNNYLTNCDWSWSANNGGSLDIQEKIDKLYETLYTALDHFAPVKTINFKRHKHPWYTNEHKELIRLRDRLYKRYKRTKLGTDLFDYRLARDNAHNAIENSRLDYYANRLSNLTEPGDIWKELRHLGLCPRSVSNWGDFSAEELNAHFASISQDRDAESLTDVLDGLVDGDEAFRFRDVTQEEVLAAINSIKTQAVGIDKIPQRFISMAAPTILPPLTDIFNSSLRGSTFPNVWKQSLVIALNKIPSPAGLGDFRPISLLSFLSKVLERLVHNQVMVFVEGHGLMDEFQSGFRPSHSTQTALLRLTDDIRYAKDHKMVTAMLLFDFSKAFDTVCHGTLLRKLANCGFSSHALRWFASYLSGRTQAVRGENGICSEFRATNRGVPQGSILGPILFALYVRDVGWGLQVALKRSMYADDLQIYLSCRVDDLPNALRTLGNAAEEIADWARTNHLRLNVDKTKAIVFGSTYYITEVNEATPKHVIHVRGATLPLEESVKCLGVILDNTLCWKEQVQNIRKKANKLMYRLFHFRRCTTLELRKHLIQSLLIPKLDYCSVVIADMSAERDELLQRVVNRGIRYIYGVRWFEHITPYRRELGWLSTSSRRQYFSASLVHKILHSGKPTYLAGMFSVNQRTRPVRGEYHNTLKIPRAIHTTFYSSFQISSASLYNSLPSSLIQLQSHETFKSHLFKLLLEREINGEEHDENANNYNTNTNTNYHTNIAQMIAVTPLRARL